MTSYDDSTLFDLADGTLSGPEWDAWLAAHPEAAAEVALAQRVRALVSQLNTDEIRVPAGFEQRLLARARDDVALRDLLNLGLGGIGYVLRDLMLAIFGASSAQPTVANA